jgi:hypothetical protein
VQVKVARRQQIEGWGVSLILHGMLLVAILPLFRPLPAPIHPEPFRWNVAIIESTEQPPEAEPVSHSVSASETVPLVADGELNPVYSTTDLSQPSQQAESGAVSDAGLLHEVMQATAPPKVLAQRPVDASPPVSSITQSEQIDQEASPSQRERADEQDHSVAARSAPIEQSAGRKTTRPSRGHWSAMSCLPHRQQRQT